MTNLILTAYCWCHACTGHDHQPTASGRRPVVGVTIAAPRSVPLGTRVALYVPGWGVVQRRVDDRTHRRYEGRWDVFVRSHREAREFGLRTATRIQ